MVRQNRDFVRYGCVKGVTGKVVFQERKASDSWKANYVKLSNEEFVWEKHSVSYVRQVNGPSEKISVAEVKTTIAKIKIINLQLFLGFFQSGCEGVPCSC